MFYYSEIGSHVKLPRSIKIEKVNEILQNLEVISTIFEEGSIIGFIECIEDNICTYMKENPIDSILKKNIKSTANDNKEIKYASTEKIYEETISSAFVKYQHVVDFIQDPTKTGTPNESVVICCMRKANNPVEYNVTEDGPLDIKAGKKLGLKSSESCDFMSFGPIYTSLHADLYYTTRNSLIPSWNVGVIKIWILRKKCDAVTNRIGSTRASTLASKDWKPADELNYILTQKEHYVLLIQRPGQIIRHYGRHFHCVLTAIDPIINPTGLSLTIGRRDKYTEDNYSFCSASKQRLTNTKAKGYIQVSRKLFLTQNISKADKRKLGPEFLDRKERARKRTPRKKGGFQAGNKLYARSSVVRILFN
jgi:hypothetical protein